MRRNKLSEAAKKRALELLAQAADAPCRDPYVGFRFEAERRQQILLLMERHYSRRVARISTLEEAEALLREAIARPKKNHPRDYDFVSIDAGVSGDESGENRPRG